MASIVTICNLALSRINARRIQALDDNMKEARECTLHYEIARDAVLADHDWTFARKRVTLALLTTTYSGWTYAYAYPSDCIAPRHIYDGIGARNGTSYDFDLERFRVVDNVNYEICVSADLNSKVILTEESGAEMRYTARVTNSAIFPPVFVSALSYKLAMELSIPLKADVTRLQSMSQLYVADIAKAKAVNSNSEHNPKQVTSSFIRVRG